MTLVDASAVALAQSARSAQALGTSFATIEADLTTWHPDRADYDLAIVANLHPGPVALAAMLGAAALALRAGGHLYVVGHHLSSLGRNGLPDPDRLLTDQRLRDALPGGLDVEILDTRPRRSDHDQQKRGGDAVVLAWATKLPAGSDRPTAYRALLAGLEAVRGHDTARPL